MTKREHEGQGVEQASAKKVKCEQVKGVRAAPQSEFNHPPSVEPSELGQAEDSPYMNAQQIVRRIKLQNVSKHFMAKDVRKWLLKVDEIKVQPWAECIKVRKAPKSFTCLLTLPDEATHQLAFKVMSGLQLQCKKEVVEVSEQVEDVKARPAVVADPNDTRTPFERIADQTTPYWKLSYQEQLDIKKMAARKALSNFTRSLKIRFVPLDTVVASPTDIGYRTKCDFAIGINHDGERTVGFMAGAFKDGQLGVSSAKGLKHVSDSAITIAETIEDFVKKSPFTVWDKVKGSGFFRMVLVRTPSTKQNMAILQCSRDSVSDKDIEKFELSFTEHCREAIKSKNVPLKVVGLQYYSGVNDIFCPQSPIQLLMGDSLVVEEKVLGYKFNISPTAFFQVNTPATERLYDLLRDWASNPLSGNVVSQPAKTTTLLDLCCGTGTIGICLAKAFHKVVGIEIVPESIEDRTRGRTLESVLKGANGEYVALLDPPRGGVHPSVIKAIRGCSAINRIIYVSCDVNQAARNFTDLCRPSSQRFPGRAFRPLRAAVVDLFPYTKHFEVVVEFQRLSGEGEDLTSGNISATPVEQPDNLESEVPAPDLTVNAALPEVSADKNE